MKRGDKILLCLDTLILATPIIIGTAFYATVVVTEVGVKSLRNLIWGEK